MWEAPIVAFSSDFSFTPLTMFLYENGLINFWNYMKTIYDNKVRFLWTNFIFLLLKIYNYFKITLFSLSDICHLYTNSENINFNSTLAKKWICQCTWLQYIWNLEQISACKLSKKKNLLILWQLLTSFLSFFTFLAMKLNEKCMRKSRKISFNKFNIFIV